MKIAIIGAGFTGLSAAYYLTKKGHHVEIFEKEKHPGGLAIGVKLPDFIWPIEKHYHHLFTNDSAILSLLEELKIDVLTPSSLTSILYKNKIYPFNTPFQILQFDPLPPFDRLRLAFVSLYMKLLPRKQAIHLEKYTTTSWIKTYYGKTIYKLIWEPLLAGKFGKYKDTVNAAWFWARIKKRTLRLGYIQGGFQVLADTLDQKIKSLGGKIHYNSLFQLDQLDPASLSGGQFDKVIVTTPTSSFLKMFPRLPKAYSHNLQQIPHLHALSLFIIAKKQFLPDNTYWLNVNDRKFPFIAVVEHTNFIDPKYYGGNHLIYVGNYLPPDHPYLKMSKEQLFNVYLPYLKKINPHFNFTLSALRFELFLGPYAQPVFHTNYSHFIPTFQTPIKNVYLANMDMVYPWDRGTNYAVEIGRRVAELIDKE